MINTITSYDMRMEQLLGKILALIIITRCQPGEVRGKNDCLYKEPETNPLTRKPEKYTIKTIIKTRSS